VIQRQLRRSILIVGALLLGLTAVAITPISAQTPVPATPPLRVAQLDTAEFPQITLYLAANSPHWPLPANLVGLTLNENEQTISDFTQAREAVGIDLVFVIDANDTINTVDGDDDETRLKKVQDTLIRFATQFMDPAGLDRVSVLVPDEGDNGNGRFLLQDATTPTEVVNGLVAYAPQQVGPTPLNEMMLQALEHVRGLQNENGRFQAILLLSDGALLDQQLDFAALTTQAEALNLPIYAAILGAHADPNEVANVMKLSDPTDGDFLHLAQQEKADPLFSIWQSQGIQVRLTYRTPQPQNGRSLITVSLGDQQAVTSYSLKVAPPQAALLLTPGAVVRQGESSDTPLAELTPQEHPIPLLVQWTDGIPRKLTTADLLVNDIPQVTLNNPTLDSAGSLTMTWSLAALDAGDYTLAAQVTDEFGLTTTSEPVTITLLVQRPTPIPPTPTPVPTAAPPVMQLETAVANPKLLAIAIGVLALLVVLLIWQSRRSREAVMALEQAMDAALTHTSKKETAVPPTAAHLVPADEGADPIPLNGDNVTIGRDPAAAQIILDDASVSRLHARIRFRAGTYWLYDEGSAGGTYLEFQRLGLTPQPLKNGSVIQFGQVRCIFKQLAVND